MACIRTMVILANSIKHKRYCVAGKDIRTGEWIRPVATANGEGLSKDCIAVENPYGTFMAKPLQIVEMDLGRHVPLVTQPENYLADGRRWRQRYTCERSRLQIIADTPDHLWMYAAESYRFPRGVLKRVKKHQSLYLVFVEAVEFRVSANTYGRKRILASFIYNGQRYQMSVTDPRYASYFSYDIGYEWQEHGRYLCLSQTDDYHGYCYKVVAAVL